MTDSEMWAIFFRYMSDRSKREKLKVIIEKKEGIKMAASVLYEISQDEKARIQYENELLAELIIGSRGRWRNDRWGVNLWRDGATRPPLDEAGTQR